MSKDYKPSWKGGLWEQESPQHPLPPKVNIPEYRPVPEMQAVAVPKKSNSSTTAVLGFAAFLLCIFSLLCCAVYFGVERSSGSFSNIPGIFGFGGDFSLEVDPADSISKAPSIRQASWDKDLVLPLHEAQDVLSPQEIYAKNLPSIVFIETQSLTKKSTGTGVVMSSDGYIITNAHVIDDANTATVIMWDNSQYAARLVGFDFAQDLAVLKVEAENLIPAEFGHSDALLVGDPSYAMGNPLGEKYRSTFTDGMISATDRVLKVGDNNLVLVQTTAAINSGNSGGALLNQYGQVVGITTIKIMSEQDTIEGMGFAIPTKRVKQVVDRLIGEESVENGMIGIRVSTATGEIRGQKVEIIDDEESNIALAGIQKGDIIIAANGKEIISEIDLNLVKCYLFAGDIIEYTVYRNGEEIVLEAALEFVES